MSEALDMVEQVRLELGDYSDAPLGKMLLYCASRYRDTGDPNWLDLAIVRLTDERKTIPVSIQIMINEVAENRLKGKWSRNSKSKVLKMHVLELCVPFMAVQVEKGRTVEEASADFANFVYQRWGHIYSVARYYDEFVARRRDANWVQKVADHVKAEAEKFPAEDQNVQSEIAKLPNRASGSRH